MDPKINNLVDLVLVVGSDKSTGLVKKSRPKHSATRLSRNSAHFDSEQLNGKHQQNGDSSSDLQHIRNGVDINDDEDDLILELTDPNVFFEPKVSLALLFFVTHSIIQPSCDGCSFSGESYYLFNHSSLIIYLLKRVLRSRL